MSGRSLQHIRFRPPRLAVPAVVDWLVSAALVERSQGVPLLEGVAASDLRAIGESIGLLGRIRSRVDRATLLDAVGEKCCRELDQAYRRNAGVALGNERVLTDVARLSDRRGTCLIAIKGMALHVTGRCRPGSRPMSDLDLLVPVDHIEGVFDEMLRDGASQAGFPPSENHLPLILHRYGVAVELHHRLEGVQVGRNELATAGDLLDLRLVQEAPVSQGGLLVPRREVLAAHLIAHALLTHGDTPAAYPFVQLLADLQDLGYSGDDGELLDDVDRWLHWTVSRAEVTAVQDLVRRLQSGEPASEIVAADDPGGVVLRHFLAGVLDSDYRRSLKLTHQFGFSNGRRPWTEVARRAWRAMWLSRAQIDVIYGRPQTRWGYIGRRLWRPFDLATRTGRAVVARRRSRHAAHS